MTASDWDRIDDIRWCPVQFQRLVTGIDVRVHVVGSDCFATAIDSDATDYRYARRQDQPPPRLVAVELEESVRRRCIALAAKLRLHFAGVDLRFGDDGCIYCFEVNPSPGFSYYEAETGQPIAEAVARLLASPASDLAPAVGER
jgi:RimK-like ATP-grasp domain